METISSGCTEPQPACLFNSCYRRKRKPQFASTTVCGLLLYSKGHGPNGYSPFPMLGKLHTEGQAEEMKSIHKTSQETNNNSRSLVQNVCAALSCIVWTNGTLFCGSFLKFGFCHLQIKEFLVIWNKNKHTLHATNIQNLLVPSWTSYPLDGRRKWVLDLIVPV